MTDRPDPREVTEIAKVLKAHWDSHTSFNCQQRFWEHIVAESLDELYDVILNAISRRVNEGNVRRAAHGEDMGG